MKCDEKVDERRRRDKGWFFFFFVLWEKIKIKEMREKREMKGEEKRVL